MINSSLAQPRGASVKSPKKNSVIKHVLDNGMTVLVQSSTIIPKVSTQLWYYVGSKDEQSKERGLAHLIEHMIFKGTKKLSESDINEITHKLSGSTNAFTSYDYTGYLFDFPSQNWQAALPILADCMRNCRFDEQHLNSEFKAVIQELKMYKDNYGSSLVEAMMAVIFPDHPYHHPIIGYKQDLWSLQRESLVNFYKKHYVPNNATLVVVGDVNPDEVHKLAQQHFGAIAADPSYKRQEYYHSKDLMSQHVQLYRDMQQPVVMVAWVVPGSKEKREFYLDVLTWILASGKGSRLYRLVVDEQQLVTDIDAFLYDLFDHGLFFIEFQPKNSNDTEKILALINQEIQQIIDKGLTDIELRRGMKKTETDLLSTLESNQKNAYIIGKFFLATGNENYLSSYVEHDAKKVAQEINNLLTACFRPTVMHVGKLLPLPENERKNWEKLQEISDAEDARILAGRTRESIVEPAVVAKTIQSEPPLSFSYPHYQKMQLNNGLEVLYFANTKLPKIELILELKAKSYYDPEQLVGLNAFMSALLPEGTKSYSGEQLAQEIESYGMTLTTSPGYITLSMLTQDFKKGLTILNSILTEALFDDQAVEKVRAMMISDINNHWDNPSDFAGDFVRQHIYKGHPYSKSRLGTLEAIKKITRQDIIDFYHKTISPRGARLSIVGDFNNYPLQETLQETIGAWQGQEVASLEFPVLKPIEYAQVTYKINRDQIVLVFAGRSVDRKNKDYDKLLIFDQIFSGGVLGSMSSRLFQLREQTGLFYTIGGSTLSHSDEQPGMIFIKTIVSLDRLAEAERAIKNTIDTIIDSITQDEFESARNAIINSLVDNFETDRSMAATFLALARYNLPADYFDTRALAFEKMTLVEVKEAAKKVLDSKKLMIFKIGRV